MSDFKHTPTRDWIVIENKSADTTEGGIYVGEKSDAIRRDIAKVLAVGPTCEVVKEGDTVLIHPETQGLIVEIPDDSKKYVMINEFQVCLILN